MIIRLFQIKLESKSRLPIPEFYGSNCPVCQGLKLYKILLLKCSMIYISMNPIILRILNNLSGILTTLNLHPCFST